MTEPPLSILLPFRNAAATLAAALESVRVQTFDHWELLAVDDGSGDASRAIAAAAARRDPRVRVLANAGPPGIIGALGTAAAAARGSWLARMDADDCCRPGRLEAQWELTAADDVIATAASVPAAAGEGMKRYVAWTNSLLDHDAISRARFIENPVIHPTVMMRREVFDRAGGYREAGWAEDHDLWLRLLEADARFVKVPEAQLEWRDPPDRLTRSDPRYGEGPRQRMRAHFLARLPEVAARGVAIAGAGPIGKSLARELRTCGVPVRGFFEVHPRRIGETIHGAEVAALDDFPRRWRDAVLLSAVGIAGVREEIRALAEAVGRVEGRDFWCVC
jgi:glycosyltransferase involved in cell wall biosynthesis